MLVYFPYSRALTRFSTCRAFVEVLGRFRPTASATKTFSERMYRFALEREFVRDRKGTAIPSGRRPRDRRRDRGRGDAGLSLSVSVRELLADPG